MLKTRRTSLHYSNDETDTDHAKNHIERIGISGVSVSTKGFHVLLQTRKGILPLAVTKDPQDSYKATSPEALTILQLLSHVDMAGAVLPPETLARMAISQSETKYYLAHNATRMERALAEYIQTILPPECTTYKDAHPWFQSRMTLPQITLDQLTLVYSTCTQTVQCRLTCALPKNILWTLPKEDDVPLSSSFVVDVTPELVEPLAYQYNPQTSHIFTSLALALRYKAPIVLQVEDGNEEQEYYYPPQLLDQDFAERTSVQKLHQQTSRISQNIAKGFEVNKLMGALQIAKRLGDKAAIQKIQDKLDEYDRMDDLPVIAENETSKEIMRVDNDDSNAFQ